MIRFAFAAKCGGRGNVGSCSPTTRGESAARTPSCSSNDASTAAPAPLRPPARNRRRERSRRSWSNRFGSIGIGALFLLLAVNEFVEVHQHPGRDDPRRPLGGVIARLRADNRPTRRRIGRESLASFFEELA